MSGPIVRRYGFPNFEQIFGAREIQHGADESKSKPSDPKDDKKPEDHGSPPGKDATEAEKQSEDSAKL